MPASRAGVAGDSAGAGIGADDVVVEEVVVAADVSVAGGGGELMAVKVLRNAEAASACSARSKSAAGVS
jgi:hypothetical protein